MPDLVKGLTNIQENHTNFLAFHNIRLFPTGWPRLESRQILVPGGMPQDTSMLPTTAPEGC